MEPEQRRIEFVKRVAHHGTTSALFHSRPIFSERSLKIGRQALAYRSARRIAQSECQAVYRRCGAGLLRDGVLRIIESLPHDYHRESQQYGIKNANRSELK